MTWSLTRAEALRRLGLDDRATPHDVVAAFRRLARATHPDVAHAADAGDAARPEFGAISDAYRRLLDDRPASPSAPAPTPAVVRVRRSRPPSPVPAPMWAATTPPIVAGPVRIHPSPSSDAAGTGGSDD